MPIAISKKGIASPPENMVSSNPPCNAVAEVEASRRTDPRIGPTHGVHPKAKAEPRIREFTGLPRSKMVGTPNFASRAKKGIFSTLSMNNPKIITKTPPILPSQKRYGARN